jgi:hypothetical protein
MPKYTNSIGQLTSIHEMFKGHLIDVLKQPLYEMIKRHYNEIESKQKLKSFQMTMKAVKTWDYNKIKYEIKFVMTKSNTKYINNLIKSCIISGIKMLVKSSTTKRLQFDYKVPELIDFFNRLFVEVCKKFYSEPQLICDNKEKNIHRLKNLSDSINLIEDAIKKTINLFLPYGNILEIYIQNFEINDDSESESESDEEPEEDNEEDYEEPEEDYEDNVEELEEDNKEDYEEPEEDNGQININEQRENVIDITNEDLQSADNIFEDGDLTEIPEGLNMIPPSTEETKMILNEQPQPQNIPEPKQVEIPQPLQQPSNPQLQNIPEPKQVEIPQPQIQTTPRQPSNPQPQQKTKTIFFSDADDLN